ncbi:MAG: Stk1 family PASTA domain-containing Ser/Thr kinase [Clostridia bacterium]|nr:Stk1 family PASTA domain-containing Ser/Thr kinase [Clostridia bacterium]
MDKYLGKRLDGRYEIQEIIGVGGMAVVYKAYDNVECKTVAIKILKDEFLENDEFLRRFKNESKAIAMLSHPNIVQVNDVSFGDLIQYIVMEYIDGITLKEYIETNGSLRWNDAVYFAMQILRALQHAHDKGIVHRDVKPQNIMVLADGTIKVADFGIARFARSNQRTVTDMAIGSVHYISPEQARGEKTDEKSDIYSVGVILYEMLTGKMPFDADSAVSVAIMQLQRDPQLPTEINPSIPKGLEQITIKAMQKSPERRYQSAAEMLCDLEEIKKDPAATFNHNYYVDSSPTKFVDELSYAPASASPDAADDDADDGKVKSAAGVGPIVPILAGIAAAFVLALIILGIIFYPKIFGKTEDITMPSFIDRTVDEVKSDPELSKFNVVWIEQQNSDYADKGAFYIFKQDPAPGESVKNGAKLTLYYNTETGLIQVPNVIGHKEDIAKNELDNLKCRVEYISEDQCQTDCKPYCVDHTVPGAGTYVYEGAEIVLFVFSDDTADFTSVPKILLGMKSDDAERAIRNAGLEPKIVNVDIRASSKDSGKFIEDPNADIKQFSEDTTSKGCVIAVDHDSEEKLQRGTKVKIFVSTGNYGFDYKVDLPDDIYPNGSLVLTIDGKSNYQTSISYDIAKNKSYTFENLTVPVTMKEVKLHVDIQVEKGEEGKVIYSYIDATVDPYENKVIGKSITSNYPKYEKEEQVETGEEDG